MTDDSCPLRLPQPRVWTQGLLAIATALLANLLVREMAVALVEPSPAFLPLTLGAVITATAAGAVGATVLFSLIALATPSPVPIYAQFAALVFTLSLIPPALMILAPGFRPEGYTFWSAFALMALHFVPWATCDVVFGRLGSEEDRIWSLGSSGL